MAIFMCFLQTTDTGGGGGYRKFTHTGHGTERGLFFIMSFSLLFGTSFLGFLLSFRKVVSHDAIDFLREAAAVPVNTSL